MLQGMAHSFIPSTHDQMHSANALLSFPGDEDPALPPESYHGPSSLPVNIPDSHPHLKKSKGKKFSYQSTVRILEKRKLEEKLAREVAEKERLRLKEMEAMKKVGKDHLIF